MKQYEIRNENLKWLKFLERIDKEKLSSIIDGLTASISILLSKVDTKFSHSLSYFHNLAKI